MEKTGLNRSDDEERDQSPDEEDSGSQNSNERKDKKAKNGKPKAGRPKKVENEPPLKLKNYFSNNTAAMILANSNYIHHSSLCLKQNVKNTKMAGTTTFCFYEGYYDDGNYKNLPRKQIKEFKYNGGDDMQRLIQSLMVTMPTFVFDQFLELILFIMDGVHRENSNKKIEADIKKQIHRYPYLTFRQAEVLNKIGYKLEKQDQYKVDSYIATWIAALVELVENEMKGLDAKKVFDDEYNKSQKIKTTIPWVKKRPNFDTLAKRRSEGEKHRSILSEEDEEQEDDENSDEQSSEKPKSKLKSKPKPKKQTKATSKPKKKA